MVAQSQRAREDFRVMKENLPKQQAFSFAA
jgi:hypothetical protein